MSTPKFLTVQDCIEWLPEEERIITLVLREIILDSLSGVTEKLSYNVPHYFGNKSICFIWPGSVLWGKNRIYEGVRMGITRASLINLDSNYFKLQHRKYVAFNDIKSIDEIDEDEIRLWLEAALVIDQSYKR